MIWIPIQPPPIIVHVYDYLDGTQHPFTPTEIRAEKVGFESGIWVKEPYLGIVLNVSEHAWRVEDIRKVQAYFARPAKGPGYVEIIITACAGNIQKEALISTKIFDQKVLDWTKHVLAVFNLACIFTEEIDEGYDA